MPSTNNNLVPSDAIIDADSDTKIQVEESSDEDLIRFDVEGTEIAQVNGKGFEMGVGGFFIGQNTTYTANTTIAADENAFLIGPVAFSGTLSVAGILQVI